MGGGALWSAHAADLIQWFEQRRAELPATILSPQCLDLREYSGQFLRGLGPGYCPRPAEYAGGRARGGFGRPLRVVVEGAWS